LGLRRINNNWGGVKTSLIIWITILNKERIALIDGDELCYKAAFSAQKQRYFILEDILTEEGFLITREVISFNTAKEAKLFVSGKDNKNYNIDKREVIGFVGDVYKCIDEAITTILFDLNTTEYSVYLASGVNYRENIAILKPYKGNRPEKPHFYGEARKYLLEEHMAVLTDNQEVDDALGIMSYCYAEGGKYEPIIVSQDKDLDMIKGLHYNLRVNEVYSIDEDTADLQFYLQLLTGDDTDNIPGIYRVGKVKAEAALLDCKNNVERYNKVLDMYYTACKGNKLRFETAKTVEEIVLEIGRLLWIRRRVGEMWNPPIKLTEENNADI
jgi:hypothetical protein